MRSQFGRFILNSPQRIPMPIGVYAGLEITGASVQEAVTNSDKQAEAVIALHERFNTRVMLTAMDLSVEAELFGSQIRISEEEISTVIGRLVTSEKEIDQLALPKAGDGRTAVHLQTAQKLVLQANGCPVLGGIIGPFSLAARLFGVSEALELSVMNPRLLEKLLQKVTLFLTDYVMAFREQGVAGVIMAEPAAGLLSPRGLSQFSSAYVRQIVEISQSEEFSIILHNCGARLVHLPKILEAGAEIYHFGAPMDIAKALEQVDREVILAGNLDPTSVFYGGTAEEVATQTLSLMKTTLGYKNFIASSGCDIPPKTPVDNLDVFFKVVGSYTN